LKREEGGDGSLNYKILSNRSYADQYKHCWVSACPWDWLVVVATRWERFIESKHLPSYVI